jgi:predicted aspartyl protease
MTPMRFDSGQFHAYTATAKVFERSLVTYADIQGHVLPGFSQEITGMRFKGIWDTGATNTAIAHRVAEKLGLTPYRYVKTSTASGDVECPVYYATIFLPCNVFIANLPVAAMRLPENVDFLLGMDLIHLGDFAITHANDRTRYTFQMPSSHDFDFHSEIVAAGLDKPESERGKI